MTLSVNAPTRTTRAVWPNLFPDWTFSYLPNLEWPLVRWDWPCKSCRRRKYSRSHTLIGGRRPAHSKKSNRLDAPSASCVLRPWKDCTTPIGTWRLSIGTAQNERRYIGQQWVDIDCAAEERLLREADTSTTDKKGQTLLHLAVDIGSPQMVALSLNMETSSKMVVSPLRTNAR